MPSIQMKMRTAYVMEYIPKGGRKPRLELVTEAVPVLVEVAGDELRPAMTYDEDGSVGLYVRDGMLYEPQRLGYGGTQVTVTEFGEAMRGNGDHFSTDMLFLDKSLGREDVKTPFVFAGTPRSRISAREVLRDEREHGLATAQGRAGAFLARDGMVFRRPEAPPMLFAAVDDGELSVSGRYRSATGTSVGTGNRRVFRYGDVDGVVAFAERMGVPTEGVREKAGNVARVTWTQEGLAADAMTAWWLLWTARLVGLYPGETHNDHRFMTSDPEIILKVLEIREATDRWSPLLLPAAEAVQEARHVRDLMAELAAMRDMRHRPNLRSLCEFAVAEFDRDVLSLDLDGVSFGFGEAAAAP